MAKIKWTKWSIKDLQLIHEYISNDSKFYADRFVTKIITRVEQLDSMPLSGRVVPEKEDPNLRELIEGNYRIFYKIAKNSITIVRVHNSSRNIK
jgi:toxin ParE1/3/4